MKPGFYLKSGMHWLHITEGFGCEWVVCADPAHATRFDTRAETERWKVRLDSRRYATPCTVAEVPPCSYFLDDREVSVTDLLRDYPVNEQLSAAISVIQPGQRALISTDGQVYELRAEVAKAQRRAA